MLVVIDESGGTAQIDDMTAAFNRIYAQLDSGGEIDQNDSDAQVGDTVTRGYCMYTVDGVAIVRVGAQGDYHTVADSSSEC